MHRSSDRLSKCRVQAAPSTPKSHWHKQDTCTYMGILVSNAIQLGMLPSARKLHWSLSLVGLPLSRVIKQVNSCYAYLAMCFVLRRCLCSWNGGFVVILCTRSCVVLVKCFSWLTLYIPSSQGGPSCSCACLTNKPTHLWLTNTQIHREPLPIEVTNWLLSNIHAQLLFFICSNW